MFYVNDFLQNTLQTFLVGVEGEGCSNYRTPQGAWHFYSSAFSVIRRILYKIICVSGTLGSF